MSTTDVLSHVLARHYGLQAPQIHLHRDGGSMSYLVSEGGKPYFLRVVRPQLLSTAMDAVNIHVYLQNEGFSVPPILFTQEGTPYVQRTEADGAHLYILYAYIEGTEPAIEDTERVGELVGQFHNAMSRYPGKLKAQGKAFFIDRYVDILQDKQHPQAGAYRALGDRLWKKVESLPRGFCHCDLYRGNIHKDGGGKLYILDFDTCCNAFPMYDISIFCDGTDYFRYSEEGFCASEDLLARFVRGYTKHRPLLPAEIEAFYALVGIHHFQVQATIVAIYGLHCNPPDFEARQLDWLHSWLSRAEKALGHPAL